MMRKVSIFTLVLLVMFSTLFVSCKEVDQNLDKAVTYLSLCKSAYEKVVTFACPYLQHRDNYDKFVLMTNDIKKYWNLAIDGLEVFLQNKDPKGQQDFIVNLDAFKDLANKIIDQFELGDKYKLLLGGTIEAATILAQTVVPNLKIVEEHDTNLDYLKIAATCQQLPKEVKKLDFSKAKKFSDFPEDWKKYESKYE